MERRKMLILLGAKLDLTPAEKGMRGAVNRAQELIDRDSENAVHPAAVRERGQPLSYTVSRPPKKSGTIPQAAVDVVVSGVGTGGTISGVGEVPSRRSKSSA